MGPDTQLGEWVKAFHFYSTGKASTFKIFLYQFPTVGNVSKDIFVNNKILLSYMLPSSVFTTALNNLQQKVIMIVG